MSCPHGNHEESCDLCDEVDAAYKSGYEAGLDALREVAEFSIRELDTLYCFAVSNGIHEADIPPHVFVRSAIDAAMERRE